MTKYVRPSYEELEARIEADLAAMPAVLRVPLSQSWARGNHSAHGHLDWIADQCSPLTCELERLYDWAALYNVPRLDATYAIGFVLATGTIETPLLAGTQLRGQSNGLDYAVLEAVQLTANPTPVHVRCLTTGTEGNLIAGQVLTLIDPVPGCSNTLTIDGNGITGGAPDELVDDWRARVCDEWQVVVTDGARSGRPADYRFWARSAHPSVTTALVQLHTLGLGTVIVRPICNGLADRLPTQAILDAIAAKLATVAPATADWRVVAPLKRQVVIGIDLLPTADTAQNRAAITAAENAAVLAETSETAVLGLAEIDAAAATVTTQYTRLYPLADIAVAAGEVLVLSPIEWA
ncbi:baseplate J/gp47 family protein [Herbaspirillum chlorophenolicum]|uniref:baseplate J/gp47 family protein n=1 Tax=Herbaspirillum chlorophenolicum TaxID=211589 RepID=UPI00067B474B|nr:baseplate J/gp47 family protein [Herbaspirillum chlorophenolicum]